MRPIALLQITLLLLTCILPEGRILMSRGQACNDDACQCSPEARQNGSCCAARKHNPEEANDCCRQGGGDAAVTNSSPACCSQHTACRKPTQNCCRTKPLSGDHCDAEDNGLRPIITGCPCGGELPVVWVCHMPRHLPARVTSPAGTWTQPLPPCVNGQRFCRIDQPPTPPPDSVRG